MIHKTYIETPENARQAVLMFHGICGTPHHFDFLLPLFDDSWAVYNILLSGHGGTVQDFSRANMQTWKAQVTEYLDLLSSQYDRILVVGHSMGTLLLQQVLSHYPKIIGAVMLNVPMYPQLHPKLIPVMLRAAFGQLRDDRPVDAFFQQASSIHLSKNLLLYLGWIPRFWELLRLCAQCRRTAVPLPVPTLVVFGSKDELVCLRSKKFFENDPSARTVIFENTGHFGFYPKDQDKLRTMVQQLLQEVCDRV